MSNSADNAMLIHAAAEARRFLDKYGVTSPGEIMLEDIAFAEDIELKIAPLLGAEAHLVRVGDVGSITVSDKLRSRGLQRFAIAHELGHWCLHQGVRQKFFCSADDMREYRNSGPELEANTFAGELLMPKHLIATKLLAEEPSWETLQWFVKEFEVAPISAVIRYVELAKQPVIAVFSDGRNVRWWRENRQRTGGLWLESQQLLAVDSVAYHVKDATGHIPVLESVPWDAWFPHVRSHDDGELFEIAAPLEEEGCMLSLLWMPSW
jgi:Zn-dependent peptidase ImmA (M78 family)